MFGPTPIMGGRSTVSRLLATGTHADSNSYSFGQIGRPGGFYIVTVHWRDNAVNETTLVRVRDFTAAVSYNLTNAVKVFNADSGIDCEIWYGEVPAISGNALTEVFFDSGVDSCGVQVYHAPKVRSTTPYFADGDWNAALANNNVALDLVIPSGGFGIAALSFYDPNRTITWGVLTDNEETQNISTGTPEMVMSGVYRNATSRQTVTPSVGVSGGVSTAVLSVASWR